MENQYKFQWSSAKSNGEIVVVRSNDWANFIKDVDIAKKYLREERDEVRVFDEPIPEEEYNDMREAVEDPKPGFVDHTLGSSHCDLHNVEMTERKGKFGTFYSHGKKLPDGSFDYCNGKGFKKE